MILEKQNRQLREIAYIQSHKVRKPVANILGLMQLMDKSKMSEENQKYFDFLLQATQDLDKIIHEIVDKVYQIE